MNKIIISIFALILFYGCTDVEENVYDKYSATEFYASPEGSDAALASVYAQIPGNWDGVGYAGADRGWYDLNCMSSDEQVVPHRNTGDWELDFARLYPVSYTHLRAHETRHDLVCRLLLEKKNKK